MIWSFGDAGTEDVYDGRNTTAARRCCPRELWDRARHKLTVLNGAADLRDLRSPPSNRLEPLKGRRTGQHSIRLNDQYRICFVWTPAGPKDVSIIDYHR
jgi:proteic killer suppression protein